MDATCTSIRERLIATGEQLSTAEQEHVAACVDCARWVERAQVIAGALRALPRLEVPAELDVQVGVQIERWARQRPQPQELDDRQSAVASALQSLPRLRAPAVLRRLVAEELRDSKSQRARRFVGDLERFVAPPELASRVRWVEERRSMRLRVAAPFFALVAAGLALWVGALVSGPAAEDEGGYRFKVVRIASLDQMDSFTRLYAAGLTGGALGAVPPGESK